MNKFEYENEIDELAEYLVSDAMGQYDNDIATASSAIFNHMIYWVADSTHQWVNYCGAEVLRNSDNYDAWEEAYSAEDIGNLITQYGVEGFDSIRASYAMRKDVAERASYLIEQYKETNEGLSSCNT